MTTPKRTPEEIAKWLWTEMAIIWGWNHRTIPEEKSALMTARIEAALREAVDAARQEERDEFTLFLLGQKIELSTIDDAGTIIEHLIKRLDARSRAEEPKP